MIVHICATGAGRQPCLTLRLTNMEAEHPVFAMESGPPRDHSRVDLLCPRSRTTIVLIAFTEPPLFC